MKTIKEYDKRAISVYSRDIALFNNPNYKW